MGFCCCIPVGLQYEEAGMIFRKEILARQTQAMEAARIIREFDEQPEELEFHR